MERILWPKFTMERIFKPMVGLVLAMERFRRATRQRIFRLQFAMVRAFRMAATQRMVGVLSVASA